MIDDKYRPGNFNINSEEEIKKLYGVAENVFNNMEDPQDSMNTVSAQTYDRSLTDKLYDIANNLSAEQLNSIIDENIKIEENQNSITDVLPNFFNDEKKPPMTGEFDGDSEDETETQTDGESSNEILPEDPNLLIQNNNSGVPRPRDVTSRPPSIDEMTRREEYNIMSEDNVLNNHK
jgi:hypothetical protein